MNEFKRNISVSGLLDFVKKHQVAWQECDSLIMFTEEKDCINNTSLESLDDYDSERNDQFFEQLSNSKQCMVIDRLSDSYEGFEDLLEWAESDNLLLMVDETIMICIASCDKDKVLRLQV